MSGLGSNTVARFSHGLLDSVYWSFGAVTGMVDKTPRSWGGRIALTGHGWFMMILLASYTANLASFLTTEGLSPVISDYHDVATSLGKYKLALPDGLSQLRFIQTEKEQHGYGFRYEILPDWKASLQAVKNDKTISATFMDEPDVQYYILKDLSANGEMCKLMTVGNSFNPSQYGFAFHADSTEFVLFSQAIALLKEQGAIEKIINNETYMIGRAANSWITNNCTNPGASAKFLPDEFYGLVLMSGVMLVVSLVISAYEKSNKEPESSNSAKVAPDVEAPKSRVQGLWKQAALGSGESSEEVHPSVKAGIETAIKQAVREERVHQQEVQNLRLQVDRPPQQLLIVDVP